MREKREAAYEMGRASGERSGKLKSEGRKVGRGGEGGGRGREGGAGERGERGKGSEGGRGNSPF